MLAALEHCFDKSVLVAHSGAGAVASAAFDTVPNRVAQVIYVDSGPTADGGVPRPDISDDIVGLPLPSFDDLEADRSSLVELDQETLDRFRYEAVPHPAGALREPVILRELATARRAGHVRVLLHS